jgi:hypothetical protein
MAPERILIVACGALAREIKQVLDANGWSHATIQCLPPELHNRPELIPGAVAEQIRGPGADFDRVYVAYADCGTGGRLDAMLEAEGVERLPGAHCYEFFAGSTQFQALADAEPGTFYLTDFLARHFDRLVWRALGLDRHPELLATYFGNYRRLVYLSQRQDPDLHARAVQAAESLGLEFQLVHTGLQPFAAVLDVEGEVRA